MDQLLKSLLNRLKKLFGSAPEDTAAELFNAETVAVQIEERERERPVEPGRRIHRCRYRDYELFLDMDITNTYRITVYRGSERVYSFTVYCEQGDYRALEKAYSRIAGLLDMDVSPGKLPDDELLKGFYYGG